MIEEAQQVCVLENHNIYQISSVNFVSLEVSFIFLRKFSIYLFYFQNEAEIKKKQKWKDMTKFFEIIKKVKLLISKSFKILF